MPEARLWMVVLTLISLLLGGCGFQGAIKNIDSNPVVKTLSVSDYLYRTVGSCADHSLRFKSLIGSGIQLWSDPNLPIVVGTLQIFLLQDGTYVARYWEHTDGTKSSVEEVSGTYTSTTSSITLSGLGTAILFEMNNKFGLAFTIARDFISSGLSGREILMRSELSDEGLETYEDVCPAS